MTVLLRLDNNQSTSNVVNIHASYQATKTVIDELKQRDPVFDYPDLPEGRKDEG
jgi:hypothetical protein